MGQRGSSVAADAAVCERCNKVPAIPNTMACGHTVCLEPCLNLENADQTSAQCPFGCTETSVTEMESGTSTLSSPEEPPAVCPECESSHPASCKHSSKITSKTAENSKRCLTNCLGNADKNADRSKCYRRLVLAVVAVAIFLDNVLLSSVVPIVPDVLMTFKTKTAVKSLLEHSGNNCTSDAPVVDLVVDAMESLTPLSSSTQTQPTLSESDFLDPTVATEQERREVVHALQKLKTLAKDCNINTTAIAGVVRETRMDGENLAVGILFASKPLVQLIVNPMIGPLTNKIGYSIPMFIGLVIIFGSTITFAFAESYFLLLLARSIQGLGSAFSTVSVGPTYAGIVYHLFNKSAPFLILSALTAMCGVLQIIVFKPKFLPEEEKGTSLCRLLMDPYILVGAGGLTFGTFGMAVLEAMLPMWMKKNMNSNSWQQGIVFLASSLAYLLTTNVVSWLFHKVGHWLKALLGMILTGLCLICISNIAGLLEASLMPEMGSLVDLRHVAVYGSVYGIADAAFCCAFAIDRWTRAVDGGNAVHAVYVDFKKAFDNVPHQRLLYKLSRIGIRGNLLRWIQSFLIGRSQIVHVGDRQSAEVAVESGVPQGSVLGPTLFIIYVNDCVSELNCDVAMFADDVKLWSVIRTELDEERLQEDLTRLEKWSQDWLLPFNVTKCNVLRVGRTRSQSRRVYYLNGVPLQESTTKFVAYEDIQEAKLVALFHLHRKFYVREDRIQMFIECQQLVPIDNDEDRPVEVEVRAETELQELKDLGAFNTILCFIVVAL
nr:unnamed protein product [Spirometra erinaceieuropaei]